MVGHRTRRWIERFRAWFGGGNAPEATAHPLFTARSSPPGVTQRPPSATAGAVDAQERTPTAPSVPADPGPTDPPVPPAETPDLAVHVHRARLRRDVGPLELSPTEALKLADEGHTGLARRVLPPDGTPEGSRD